MNKADGTLTSPNFGVNDLGNYHFYDHNSNCTWILNADEGHYITLEIEHFGVNHNNTYDIYFYKFFNKVHNYSFLLVTFSQSMMDQIFNHHQYQNWTPVLMMRLKKVFQVQDLICWFNLWQIMNLHGVDSQLKSITHQSTKSVRIGWTLILGTWIHPNIQLKIAVGWLLYHWAALLLSSFILLR